MNRAWWLIAASGSALLMACGGAGALPTTPGNTAPSASAAAADSNTAGTPTTTPPATSGGASPAAQIANGLTLYGANCQSCHGASGSGGSDPPLVSIKTGAIPSAPAKGAKRTAQLNTAGDLFQYIKTTMPEDNPASLKDDEYLAVTAWILSANNIAMSAPLDATSAASISLH